MKVKQIYEESKKKMEQAKEALVKRYTTMRGGRARADLVSEIKVECYGSRMPLKQLSNISVPEPRLIVIEPWDKSLIKDIEKAILNSSLGINPTNDGNVIRLVIPTLTEERREELAKVVRQWAEEARISVRNIRREAREKIEKLEKEKEISEDEKRRAQKEIQALTDDVMEEIDSLQEKKVSEIRQV
ncbi:ribosome recycling factor [Candidatus Aerophobetes bacterium]|nr:ribosome recycling factor [Candidatus Aerophobetes bacterium]